jgi:citrate lyase subunit beta/citryl-CoA lyase
MSAHRDAEEAAAVRALRSLLFVPGDRPERFAKAAASGADAIILDLEDSVVPERKAAAREAVVDYLSADRGISCIVRINPVGSLAIAEDVAAIGSYDADAIMLPKAEGATSIRALAELFGSGLPPVIPIATETPAAVFELGTYRDCASSLAALTWGAEDLPAACGAISAREADGRYTPPYEMVRGLALFAAHSAEVAAIDTIFPALDDDAGLVSYVKRARRDGFMGMLAIHPRQIPTINAGFTPDQDEVDAARAVVSAFDRHPGVGALALNGRMIDQPHLVQARRVLALAELLSGGAR